jgi:methanol--5-hydroxybenzimidazolylcobamide Co-methyltransferase
LHADSDSRFDPQAYVLRPDIALEISKEIVKVDGYYPRSKKAADLALTFIRKGYDNKELELNDKELTWLDNLSDAVAKLPDDVAALKASVIDDCEKLDPKKYDMKF